MAHGKFRFHLKAPNGEIIAASQGYETKASAEKGIAAIKTHASDAKVEDLTGSELGKSSGCKKESQQRLSPAVFSGVCRLLSARLATRTTRKISEGDRRCQRCTRAVRCCRAIVLDAPCRDGNR
jgi:uncharacterized protein